METEGDVEAVERFGMRISKKKKKKEKKGSARLENEYIVHTTALSPVNESAWFPFVPRPRGQDPFPFLSSPLLGLARLSLRGINSHTEYWPGLFLSSGSNTVARVRCKVVEREGMKCRDLLSVSASRHGVAGEMAVLEEDGV